MEQKVIHKSNSRGHTNYGWLDSHHTFSFGNYYDPNRIHFGALRVINDDIVNGGMGFGTHGHDNMEIISIPLEGALEHKDNMGNTAVIQSGDIQVMSAGSGIKHSEKNKSHISPVKFLQIWIIPNKREVTPRYDQVTLNKNERHNTLQQIISPDPNDQGVWIHQDAWFFLGSFDQGHQQTYSFKKNGNGVYILILQGNATIQGQTLSDKDGIGIWDTDKIHITAESTVEILLMDVPMNIPI